MKNLIVLSLLACFALSCDDDDKKREEEMQRLQQLRTELFELAESVTCENSSEWDFVGIGAKACGGFSEYIAYPKSIDGFLEKASDYTAQSDAFNKKWGIISDCAITPVPRGIVCDDGKAYLLY